MPYMDPMENQNQPADGHLLHLAMMKGHDGKDLTSSAQGKERQGPISPGAKKNPHERDKEIGRFFFCVGKIWGRNNKKSLISGGCLSRVCLHNNYIELLPVTIALPKGDGEEVFV